LFIEFKKPGVLEKKENFKKAIEQLKKYISAHSKSEELLSHYFGVVLDGYKIGFLRFINKEKAWNYQGPYDLNSQTILKFLEALRGLNKKPLDAKILIKDFGPNSSTAKSAINFLYNKLLESNSERTKILFGDWKRVFSQVCAYSPEKIKGLEKYYDLSNMINPESLLFAIHSYYALIMKIIAAEVAILFSEPYMRSYILRLEDAFLKSHKDLKSELEELEEGGIFLKIGITNYIEADYFSWYLNEWDKELANIIIEIINKLSYYEVGTAELEPERIQDLFKKLYQYLVPQKIRRNLGEYYTPEWLAELLMNEMNYYGDPDKRILDPSCGSGTFLVLALKKAREYREKHFLDIGETLEKITKNIVGFDLNPLAVLASRTNYLIAIGDYLRQRKTEKITIPVFLADSILVERKKTLYKEVYVLKTIVGEFHVPISVIENKLLSDTLTIIEDCVKNQYTIDALKKRLQKEIYGIKEKEIEILIDLFKLLSQLEKKEKDKIWLRILKNSFAPLFEEKFDCIIGNPPWINWENLPSNYREITKGLWEKYGLIEKSQGAGLGRIRRDISSLFTVRCFSEYLNNDGILGFLIPFNILKSQGGSGFRKFIAYNTEIIKIEELSELYPFEGATNRTGLLILKNGKSDFPVPCKVWISTKTTGISQEDNLQNVYNSTTQYNACLYPIESNFPKSPWMICTEKSYEGIKKLIKRSDYKGYEGVNTALNGVYWINISPSPSADIIIENLAIGKKSVKKIQDIIEKELIYPLLRGKDVKKWYIRQSEYIFLPHDPKTGGPLEEEFFKLNYPKSYSFISKFKKILEIRSIHKLWGKDKPFYSVYNIGPYSFAPYKVIWKDISGKISAKGEFGGAAVISYIDDPNLGKKLIIPDTTLMLIPCYDLNEAYYITAIMNSVFTRFIATGYSILHVRAHILKYIGIEKYNYKNKYHRTLSELAKNAHILSKKYCEENDNSYLKKLIGIEMKINNIIAKIYAIEKEEYEEIEKILKIFKGNPETQTV